MPASRPAAPPAPAPVPASATAPVTHLAFLRGVNIGRARRLAMADLRQVADAEGFGAPRTVLASGNLAFHAPALSPDAAAERLEGALLTRLGLRSRVTVVTPAELDALLAADPLAALATDPAKHVVALYRSAAVAPAARARLAPLAGRDWGAERLAVGERAATLWCPAGLSGGTLAQAVLDALGDDVTMRNRATMARLQALARGAAVA